MFAQSYAVNNSIWTEKFSTAKETINKKTIFRIAENEANNKRLIYKLYKQIIKLNIKKANHSSKNG